MSKTHVLAPVALLATLAFGPVGCGGDDIERGQAGESCTSRNDCTGDLYCISGVCRPASEEGDGGIDVQPRVGQRGEPCAKAADCADGLTCVVASDSASTALGRCDLANYGFTPTGKTCSAECKTPTDCCELPVGLVTSDLEPINSCADLAVLLGSSPASCEASAPPTLARECFYYKAYCDCAAPPWTCDAGRCLYSKTCTISGEKIKGCPAQTRTGQPRSTFCDLAAGSCGQAAATGCKADTDCAGKSVTDGFGEQCVTGECVCVPTTGACYRACDEELDCPQGYSCDVGRRLCAPTGQCDTDTYCARTLGDVTAKCVEKVCKLPCVTDHDCSPSGISDSNFNGRVCSGGFCADIGCSSDAECATSNDVKLFCTEPPPAMAMPGYRSAITH